MSACHIPRNRLVHNRQSITEEGRICKPRENPASFNDRFDVRQTN